MQLEAYFWANSYLTCSKFPSPSPKIAFSHTKIGPLEQKEQTEFF